MARSVYSFVLITRLNSCLTSASVSAANGGKFRIAGPVRDGAVVTAALVAPMALTLPEEVGDGGVGGGGGGGGGRGQG